MNEKARLFLGFELSAPVRNQITEEIEFLQSFDHQAIKWVSPENLHVTFIFLGSVLTGRIRDIEKVMKWVCAGFSPATLRSKGAGFFPDERFFKILWRGISDPGNSLQTMYQEMKQELAAIDITAEEREFLPHLTLGRLRRPGADFGPLLAQFKETSKKELDWPVSALTLFKSELKADKPHYERMVVSPLVSKSKD
jgi:2'-5' RNA ligase